MPPFSQSPQWKCSDCGKKYPAGKTAQHTCLIEDIVGHQMNRLDSSTLYLTPRMAKRVAFYRWCAENDRL